MQGFGFDGRCVWSSRVVSVSLEMPAILTDPHLVPALQLLPDPDDRHRRRQGGHDPD
jgi:hypothetical protein